MNLNSLFEPNRSKAPPAPPRPIPCLEQGPEGVYSYTTAHLRKEDCLVCGSKEVTLRCAPRQTLSALIEALKADPQVRWVVAGDLHACKRAVLGD